MSGFDLTELLPFYLDETDEQVVLLNDALLRLEQDQADAKALQEIFRVAHSIKGSSAVMGFAQVKELTHNLETLFDQFRNKKRALDRPALDLCFRCLDGLRDYHRDLRAAGGSGVDLSGLTSSVVDHLNRPAPADGPTAPPTPASGLPAVPPGGEGPAVLAEPSGTIRLTAVLEPNLPLPDMKARLILNRLAAKARVLATDPPSDRIDELTALPKLTVWLVAEGDPDELRELADVDGVVAVTIEEGEPPQAEADLKDEAPAAPPPLPETEPAGPGIEEARPAAEREGPRPSAEATAPEPPPAAGEAAPSAEPARPGDAPKKAKVAETLRVDVDRLDHLMNLVGELVINKARFTQTVGGLQELFRGSNARLLASDTHDRLESVSRELDVLAAHGTADDGAIDRWAAQFRRVRENFRTILAELDLIRQGREQVDALAEAVHHLGRVTDGLQKGVLDTRMVPIGPLFERFRRVIRDLSLSSNKEVVLRISGEKTELDKRMIDELSDPLIHMVRNSVDHGLETPERREAAGKPRAGTVSLQAAHRGNSVVITVSDDGAGIDCERLRRTVVARGLLPEGQARDLPERQLIPYIFAPGLSTAETVTEVSGRGVGMDIVKSRIEGLNGTVDVRTEPGRGTTFTIRLPLTLAIMPSLLVQIEGEVYAIPLDHIDEIVEVPRDQVHRIRGKRAIEVRNRVVSLLALSDVFRWAIPAGASPTEGPGPVQNHETLTVAVVQDGETTVGLVVDRLLGMQEMVLKSLEKNFRPVPGLSGASILGDGRVSLVLDVDAVIGMVAADGARHAG
jgi:two-component system chemotaxis sensor kinase CheA